MNKFILQGDLADVWESWAEYGEYEPETPPNKLLGYHVKITPKKAVDFQYMKTAGIMQGLVKNFKDKHCNL